MWPHHYTHALSLQLCNNKLRKPLFTSSIHREQPIQETRRKSGLSNLNGHVINLQERVIAFRMHIFSLWFNRETNRPKTKMRHVKQKGRRRMRNKALRGKLVAGKGLERWIFLGKIIAEQGANYHGLSCFWYSASSGFQPAAVSGPVATWLRKVNLHSDMVYLFYYWGTWGLT